MSLLTKAAAALGDIRAAYDAPLLQKALSVDSLGRTLPMQYTGSNVARWLTGDGREWATRLRGQVFRVSSFYATTAAGVPFALYKTVNGKEQRVDSHPALDLLYTPNPEQGQFWFWYQVWTELRGHGNCFITTVKPELGSRAGRPTELWVLPLLHVEPRGGSATEPVESYRYTPDLSKPGTYYDLDRTQVLHLKQYAPDGGKFGLGCIAAASREATADDATITAQVAQLQNMGPAGVLWLEPDAQGRPPELGDGVIPGVRRLINRMYKGAGNAGEFPIMPNKVGWTSLGTSAVDLDILAFRRANFNDLCGFWGVPSMLVGDKEGTTFSNLGEARRMLFTQGILPYFGAVCQELTRWLLPQLGDASLWLGVDLSAIPEMQQDKQALATALSTAWWVPVVVKQEQMGYTPDWDGPKFMVPAGLVGSDSLAPLPPTEE